MTNGPFILFRTRVVHGGTPEMCTHVSSPRVPSRLGESGRGSSALFRPGVSRAFSDLFVSVFQGVFSGGSRVISLVRSTTRDQLSALGHKHY